VCSRRRLTTEEEARGHCRIEPRGPDSGEVSGTLGGESVRISEDYSTSRLFRNDSYGRGSSGTGQSSPSNHSWNGDSELYEGAAESEFTTRSAVGVDTVIESPPSSAGDAAGSSAHPCGPISPIRRRLSTM
jgi:hypothetical protein